MSLKQKLSGLQNAQAILQAAIGEVAAADQQLRAEDESEVDSGRRILSLDAPVDEAVANMRACIDAHAEKGAADHQRSLIRAFGGWVDLQSDGTLVEQKPGLHRVMVNTIRFPDLCAFAPDILKARLEAIIRSAPYEAGPPLADRLRLAAEADVRIAAKARAHTDLCDMAATLSPPIVLALLPAEADRRERERLSQIERDRIADVQRELAEAERAKAPHYEVRMNHSAPAGVSRSNYIESNRPGG